MNVKARRRSRPIVGMFEPQGAHVEGRPVTQRACALPAGGAVTPLQPTVAMQDPKVLVAVSPDFQKEGRSLKFYMKFPDW